ncbi:MAG: hypothetical protein Fur0042_04090 [Cyanophyceae cyanobacterium]
MNSDQLRRSLRQKWLDYYRDNRLWVSRLAVWTDASGERRPVSSFIVATLAVLEPNLAHLLPLIVDLSSDPDRVVEALGLDFDPEALMGVSPEPLAGRSIRPEVLPASGRATTVPLQPMATVADRVPVASPVASEAMRPEAMRPEAVHLNLADRRPEPAATNGTHSPRPATERPARSPHGPDPNTTATAEPRTDLGPRPIATPPTPRMKTPPRHSRPDDHNDWQLIDRRASAAPAPAPRNGSPAPRPELDLSPNADPRPSDRDGYGDQSSNRHDRDGRDGDDTCEGRTRDRATGPWRRRRP